MSALELQPITIQESVENIALHPVYEEAQINNQTLAQKLFNNANVNQIESATNAKVLSIRGNHFRATDYYEDGIPLYKTANGFVDVSMYNDSSLSIDLNLGGAQGLYAPSAVGGEILLNSKKLKNGLSGSVETSFSTNAAFFNTLLAYKTDQYYFKMMLSGVKQNSFTLSDDFAYTNIQKNNERVNSDKKQFNGYLKTGYKIDNNSDIALKVLHLKGEFGLPINIYDEPSNPKETNADYRRVDDKELRSYWLYYDYLNDLFKLTLRSYYDAYTDTFNFYKTPDFLALKYDESVYEDSRLGSIVSLGYDISSKHSAKITLAADQNRHKQNRKKSSDGEEYETVESSLAYLHKYKLSEKLNTSASLKYKKQQLTKVFEFHNENLDYSDNEALDAQLTLNYNRSNQESYYLSIAHKNRFASLVELFPFFEWDIPTQNVKPEKSNNIEIATELHLLKETHLKLSAFYNEIENMILFDGIQYQNSKEVQIKGFELQIYNISIPNNEVELSYAYTNAKDAKGEKVIHVPTSKLNIIDKVSVTSNIDFIINYLYKSATQDIYNSQNRTLRSYSLLDMQLAYALSNQAALKVGVKNLLDENWQSRYAQPSEGRSFFANVKYNF